MQPILVNDQNRGVFCLWFGQHTTSLIADHAGSEWINRVNQLKQSMLLSGRLDIACGLQCGSVYSEADAQRQLQWAKDNKFFIIAASIGEKHDDRMKTIFGKTKQNKHDLIKEMNRRLDHELLHGFRTPWYSCEWPSGLRTPGRVFDAEARNLIIDLLRPHYREIPYRLDADTNAHYKKGKLEFITEIIHKTVGSDENIYNVFDTKDTRDVKMYSAAKFQGSFVPREIVVTVGAVSRPAAQPMMAVPNTVRVVFTIDVYWNADSRSYKFGPSQAVQYCEFQHAIDIMTARDTVVIPMLHTLLDEPVLGMASDISDKLVKIIK